MRGLLLCTDSFARRALLGERCKDCRVTQRNQAGECSLYCVVFLFVCLFGLFCCVALLARNQCCLTHGVLHIAMCCRTPFYPLMHSVLVGLKIFVDFVFSKLGSSVAWLLAQCETGSENFSQPHLNRISILTGSYISYSCLSAVSSQSARSDL